jgi:arylformamidase
VSAGGPAAGIDNAIGTRGVVGVTGEGFIDVSLVLHEGMTLWPGDPAFALTRVSDMAAGDRNTLSELRMGLHTGTHVDAPAHFIADGATIDAMSPEVLIGPARVIAIADREAVTAVELREHGVRAGERILLKTRNIELLDVDGFDEHFMALTEEAATYLASLPVRCVGIDYLSVGPKGAGTPVHKALLGAGVWIVEGLDLRGVEPGDYDMIAVPLRLAGAEASPVRVLLRRR